MCFLQMISKNAFSAEINHIINCWFEAKCIDLYVYIKGVGLILTTLLGKMLKYTLYV